MRISIIAVVVLLTFAADAWAVPTIIVGSHEVLPNTPDQVIDIMVSGGDAVAIVNFNAQVADGGPEVGGFIDGPSITGHILPLGPLMTTFNPLPSIFAPTMFQFEVDLVGGIFPQLLILQAGTDAGTVSANGLLARLTIDTTGFTSGTWTLNLKDTAYGDTDFFGIPINIENGDIHIVVPEPTSWALCLFAAAGLAVSTLRRRRHCKTSAHIVQDRR